MIVKMKFINISGPRNDIDRVTDLYLSRYEIQLESALSELKTVDNLRPFVEINPYKDALGKAEEFAGYLENADEISPDTSLGLDDIFELMLLGVILRALHLSGSIITSILFWRPPMVVMLAIPSMFSR